MCRSGTGRPAAAIALVVALALTGCTAPATGAGPTPQPPIDPGTSPAVVARALPADIGRVSYPLDQYRLRQWEQRLVDRAIYQLVQRCTRRFRLNLPPFGRVVDRVRRDRYGLADETEARTWAYSLDKPSTLAPPWFVPIDPDSRLHAVVTGSTGDGRPARDRGLPVGGCDGSARRTLARGATASDDDLVDALDSQAWRAARADSRVGAAAGTWKRCMLVAGYRYDNPVEAPYAYWGQRRAASRRPVTPDEKKSGVRPGAAEIRAALADVRCKRSSGFLQMWIAVAVAHQQRLVATNRRALVAHRRSLDATVRNAGVVAGSDR